MQVNKRDLLILIIITAVLLLVGIWLINTATDSMIAFITPWVMMATMPVMVVDEPPEVEFELTAYCSCSQCCGVWSDGITFSGTKATEGRTIAVDPKVISLGSVVEINGNQYVAEDIGGAIKGNRIDVYFDSHNEALKFGRQTAIVEVVK